MPRRASAPDTPRPVLGEVRRLNSALLDLRLVELDSEHGGPASAGRHPEGQHSDPTGAQAVRQLRLFDRYRRRVARLADEIEDLVHERSG